MQLNCYTSNFSTDKPFEASLYPLCALAGADDSSKIHKVIVDIDDYRQSPVTQISSYKGDEKMIVLLSRYANVEEVKHIHGIAGSASQDIYNKACLLANAPEFLWHLTKLDTVRKTYIRAKLYGYKGYTSNFSEQLEHIGWDLMDQAASASCPRNRIYNLSSAMLGHAALHWIFWDVYVSIVKTHKVM